MDVKRPNLIEGSYVELKDSTIFAVKGVSHPPKGIIAVPKYARVGGSTIKLGDFNSSMDFFKRHFPDFLVYDEYLGQVVPLIPLEEVKRVYDPIDGKNRLKEDKISSIALKMVSTIVENSGVKSEFVGITGSILLGLHNESSDVDIVVYGVKNCLKVYDALKIMRENKVTECLSGNALEKVLESRSDTCIEPVIWAKHERRKITNGVFTGRPYTLKLVPLPEEFWDKYGERRFKEIGRTTIRFQVDDASKGIFTPCYYRVKVTNVIKGPDISASVSSIVSFRSRFSEQLRDGEVGIASGRLETSSDGELRLFIGNDPKDFLMVDPS
ncbi:MAG: nucleotidyltransferase domain-containing protein [Nitrososphaerota archaeon]|nr:nucleotidyltransferase domain-containing protein [Aigarchaeota archaeon]MDW8076597.1 nucleotidyltransferase domain-containing protein [Nitrososphaerota archaeon]